MKGMRNEECGLRNRVLVTTRLELHCAFRIAHAALCCLLFLFLLTACDAHADLTSAAEQKVLARNVPFNEYTISLQIDPRGRTYRGHETARMTNHQAQATNYILFFLYPNDPSINKTGRPLLEIRSVSVDGAPAEFDANGPLLRINLKDAFRPGQTRTCDLDFQASIPEQPESPDLLTEALSQLKDILNPGEERPDYGIFASTRDILNLGLWYPALSKYDKDGWDEESYSGTGDASYFDPADFSVTIVAPADYTLVTTGTALRRVPQKDGNVQSLLESRMTRDFAIELSPKYREKAGIRGRTTIRSYFLANHSTAGQAVLEAALKAFTYYERAFGPYPYRELDVVEAPLIGGAGGVEFPGLVTVSSMLYTPDAPAGGEKDQPPDLLKELMAGNPALDQLLEFVTAHEVAHQWWNAVVGSNSKKYPFIDEAMANYSAILYFEHEYGREAAEQQMALQMKLNYQLHRMLGGQDRRVDQDAAAFKGPLEYSAIVYGKGALYFDEARKLVGDAAFFAALRDYYDRFWFRVAGPQDFTLVLRDHVPAARQAAVSELYRHWINETHGDQDIGQGDLQSLMNTLLKGQGQGTLLDDTDQKDLLKLLDELLKE